MEIVETLLAGSARIDTWRKEIKTLVNMVFGLVARKDIARLKEGEILLEETDSYSWILLNNKRSLQLRFVSRYNGKVNGTCLLPEQDIELEMVGQVHNGLETFVKAMTKLFPALNDRMRPLRDTGQHEFEIMYAVFFEVRDGIVEKFSKKSNLNFPLPIGTEVYLSVEDDEDADQGFFTVTGYEHAAYNLENDIHEQRFIMYLEYEKDSSMTDPEVFARILKKNGWQES